MLQGINWLRIGIICFLGLLLAGKTAVAQSVAIQSDAYWQLLESFHEEIQALENEPEETREYELRLIAIRLERITAVELESGQIAPVDHSFLAQKLRANPDNFEELNTLFATLFAARDVWPDPQFKAVDRQTLDEILAQPEFIYEEPELSPLAQWWQEVRRRIFDGLIRIFGERSGTVSAQFVNYALTITGTIILIIILYRISQWLLADFAIRSVDIPDRDEADEILTADSALARAQELSGAGDYRTAVRYLYLSTLLLLEERGLLRYDRSLTNREYLRYLSSNPDLSATLRRIIDIFDRVWYGYQPLEKKEYDQYVLQVEALKQRRRAS